MRVKKGFTIIETIISIMLISLLILLVCCMNLFSLKLFKMTRNNDNAFNIARGVCEMFKKEELSLYGDSLNIYITLNDVGEIESLNEVLGSGFIKFDTLDSAFCSCNKKYILELDIYIKQGTSINGAIMPNIKILRTSIYSGIDKTKLISFTSGK